MHESGYLVWRYLCENWKFNFKNNISQFCRKSAVVTQSTNLKTFLSNLAQCVEGFSEGAFKYFNAHSFFTRDLWNGQAWWISIVKLQCEYLLKVQLFWKVHKNWKNLPLLLTLLSKNNCFVKTSGRFFQIFWPSYNVWTLKSRSANSEIISSKSISCNTILCEIWFFFSFRVSEELKGQTDILYGVEAWPLDFQNYLNRNYRKKDQKPMKKAEFESRMVQFLYREHS